MNRDLHKRIGFESRKKSSIGCKQNTIIKTASACEKLIRDYDLTERHARALLLLNNEEKQLEAVKLICRDNMNVTQAEELVRTMNIPKPKPINDLRITTAKMLKYSKTP